MIFDWRVFVRSITMYDDDDEDKNKNKTRMNKFISFINNILKFIASLMMY